MFRRLRRPQHDKLATVRFDHFRQVVAFVRRHMPRTAIGAIVVAHARPFVAPFGIAASTFVVVAVPSRDQPSVREPRRRISMKISNHFSFQIANDNSRATRNRDSRDL